MSPRKPADVFQVPTVVGSLWVDRWDRGLSKKLKTQGEYDPETTTWLTEVTMPGMGVVDIGANIGYFTVLFGRAVGAGGRVLAFEPDPFNRDLLERNVRDNGLSDRVTIEPAAVTDREDTCTFHLDNTYRGVHSLSAANLKSSDGTERIEVPTTTLDAAVARAALERIDIVKIDAQGAEAQILRGAVETLGHRAHVQVLLELWPFGLENCGASVGEVIERLRAWDFSPAAMTTSGLTPLTWGTVLEQAAALSGHGSINLVMRK